MAEVRVGAVPYLIKNGKPRFMLITNKSGRRWIIPRGCREDGMTDSEVAVMEAFEEAGVIGGIRPKRLCFNLMSRAGGRRCRMKVYPLRIDKILRNWPESDCRKRKLLKLEAALEKIDDKAQRDCLKSIAESL